uniref:UDP-N-acetylglucosamine pyrophosphorylase 1 like 1 n=1 Tax=Equus asinus TaxID=9793 RepID=A0A9L0J4J7_EQUAS
MASERDVRARLQRAGQEHLLRFCAELAPGPRAALLAELEPLEPEALREHCRNAAAACARPPGPPPGLATRLRPLPPERVGSASRSDPETRRLWEEEAPARVHSWPLGLEVREVLLEESLPRVPAAHL